MTLSEMPPLHRHPGPEQDRWRAVEAMKRSDVGSARDLWARYLIICTAGALLFAATGAPVMLAWLAAYMAVNVAYSLSLLRCRPPVGVRRHRSLIAMNILSSGIFSAMPLYLFTFDDHALKILAVCGIVGHGMFNLSRHDRRSMISVWDTVSIVGSFAFVGTWQLSLYEGGPGHAVLIGFGAIAVAIYYVVAQSSILRIHDDLESARAETARSQKMRAVAQLTTGIAQDFNNLLTAIRGNIELAELGTDPRDGAEALAAAKEASDRAARLISQLLAFSHKAMLTPQLVDLGTALRDFQDMVVPILPASVIVSLEAPAAPMAIRVDPAQFEAALLDIALNARDAMAPKGGKLHISAIRHRVVAPMDGKPAAQVPAPGDYARIVLRDTGPGVPAGLLPRLAEPFFTTKAVGHGSGLGLSMVSGFAGQSGGAALFLSPPGQGLQVHLLLPLAHGGDDRPEPA